MNWNDIRPLNGSQQDGFEELICQLARKENIKSAKKFIRLGKPDAGVECYWQLENDEEWAWQAKFFLSSLSGTQWKQISKSIDTALDKRPKISKYIVAIPLDPPDARIEGKTSMLATWMKKKDEWSEKAKKKGMDVEFEAWWASDLIEKLTRYEGLTYFWFNRDEFTPEWCKKLNVLAISDLGVRYTPENNVNLEIKNIFHGLYRDKQFSSKIESQFDMFFIDFKNILTNSKVDDTLEDLKILYDKLYLIYTDIDFVDINLLPWDRLRDCLITMEEKLNILQSSIPRDKETSFIHFQISKLLSSMYAITSLIDSPMLKVSNHPFFLIDGDAGIGKSHLLADVVKERNNNILLLGQHFVTEDDPWHQIFKKLDIKCNREEFLSSLNAWGEIQKQRYIIYIDAINEGKGVLFWPTNIKGFIERIKEYEWLGLVLSVRSTYLSAIFPNEENKLFISYAHTGFMDCIEDAVQQFFSYYGLLAPSIPILDPEFQNPLLLKLVCESIKYSGAHTLPSGCQALSSILNAYLDKINSELSIKLNLPKEIKIVEKALKKIAQTIVERSESSIEYEEAFILLNQLTQDLSINNFGLLEALINEGVLTKNIYYDHMSNHVQRIYFSYERVKDFIFCSYLIDTSSVKGNRFSPSEQLSNYVKDKTSCIRNQGLLEILTILLPEKFDMEIFELLPEISEEYVIQETFIQSFKWRQINKASDKVITYINNTILKKALCTNLFIQTVISVCAQSNHAFNAYFLHNKLKELTLAERDGWWTINIHYGLEEGAIKRLIMWGLSIGEEHDFKDESLKLGAVCLSWLLTSTNNFLRDSATKSLINILKNRISILLDLMKMFKKINDPYVYERLFAVAYGCCMHATEEQKLIELSLYVYNTIFNVKGEVYPHILLRDYAREIIEFTLNKGLDLTIDIEKIKPPYTSTLPKTFPTNEEIDQKYQLEINGSQGQNYNISQNIIISSMTTEYGRGIARYGDFGRYTFQSAISFWDVNVDGVSNLGVEWIFSKYGYDVSLHGKFDCSVRSGRVTTSGEERIGKKYQWIVFHELLARIADNCLMKDGWGNEKRSYNGPWEPCVRNIDPSIINIKKSTHEKWWLVDYSNWELANDVWIEKYEDIPDLQHLINHSDMHGSNWMALQSLNRWMEPNIFGEDNFKDRKQIYLDLRSYLIPKNQVDAFYSWGRKKNFFGRWMPENVESYGIFYDEYYWSLAYKCFKDNCYDGLKEAKVIDHDTNKYICSVIPTVETYMLESGNDRAIDRSIQCLRPCSTIAEHINLKSSNKFGYQLNNNGEIVCFDPSPTHNGDSVLLINKKILLNFLEQNNLSIVWTLVGEKIILENHSRLTISGICYLDGQNNLISNIEYFD